MIKRTLFVVVAILLVATLFVTLATATILGTGAAVNFFVPTISFEFATVIAALAILIGLTFLSVVLRFLQVATSPPLHVENEGETDDEDGDDEFAEQIAEIVSEKLQPHFSKHRRVKSRR